MIIPPPPVLSHLPAGTKLRAGLGWSTVIPDHDFETYSEAGHVWSEDDRKWLALPNAPQGKKGLPVVGAAVFAQHPSTEVLSYSYDLKDGRGRRHWRPGLPLPQDLFHHVKTGGLLEGWNVAFEHWIWNHVCVSKYGWPPLPAEQLRCAMAKSRAHAWPGSLDEAGRVAGIKHQKDPEGKRLLDKFSKPRNPTKADARLRIRPEEDPEDGPRLYAYNDRDIVAEAEMSALTPDLSPTELEYWLVEQRINYRGVQVDMVAVANCAAIVQQALQQYGMEMQRLTGGIKPTEVQQLIGWLHSQGVHTDALDEEAIEALLPQTEGTVRRVLELRAKTASASVKKLYAILLQATASGRLHDLFNYHAARTGRESGNGPQPQNLPKAGPPVVECRACGHYHRPGECPWCGHTGEGSKSAEWNSAAAEQALRVIATRSLATVEHVYGDALAAVVGCLRGLFIAAPGKRLICSDFSAIEGVVAAALSGCEWRLEVFRTHGKIYEMGASKITGIPFEEFERYKKENGRHHPARQSPGKISELGLGFGGWIGAWKNFDGPGTDDEIKKNILAWRDASPEIVEMWGGQERNWRPELYGLEGMCVAAISDPGTWYTYRSIGYVMYGDVLYCRLPSGRLITYHAPRLEQHSDPKRKGVAISYEGWNSNPKAGAIGWTRMYIYGGKLFENVVQATARDILVHAIVNLEKVGYPIVLHVHDEIVAEVDEAFGSIEEFERVMATMPEWAKGWPIFARGGWIGRRYRKD